MSNITDEEREEFPHHTESAILGIRRVRSYGDDELLGIIESGGAQEQLRIDIGPDTNPSWVMSQVAQELYNRNLIDEKKLDRLME